MMEELSVNLLLQRRRFLTNEIRRGRRFQGCSNPQEDHRRVTTRIVDPASLTFHSYYVVASQMFRRELDDRKNSHQTP